MEQVLHCTPYSVAGLYDRSMMEQSARILIISPSSSPHQRSSAHHAVVISAPYAGDVSLSGGTAESLPDTVEHRRKEPGRDERTESTRRQRPLRAAEHRTR